MSADLERAPFVTTPEAVPSATLGPLCGHTGAIWWPGWLRLILTLLRHMPPHIYRRLSL